MQELTREQAIQRIRGIVSSEQDGHFMVLNGHDTGAQLVRDKHLRMEGATIELMAIFDIKEEEIGSK